VLQNLQKYSGKSEQKFNRKFAPFHLRKMYLRRISKRMSRFEISIAAFLVLAAGWILGRITEAAALGNLKF
jgi:hypothetical protein